MSTTDCSTVLRRFAGPVADELVVLCQPAARSLGVEQQAAAVYRALADVLAADGASLSHLAAETVFLRDIRRELPLLLDARRRAFAAAGQDASGPLPTLIGQAPVDDGAALTLLAAVVVPRHRDAWSVDDVRAEPPCTCEGCARSGARRVRLGDQVSLSTANLYGTGDDAYTQAMSMFDVARGLLDQCGMGFRDVVRTWIHLRDIERDYEAFNEARRAFFDGYGMAPRPASTGVQGIPLAPAHDLSLSLQAVKSNRPLDVTPMSSPLLNEAWSYGADFSRGLKVGEMNKTILHVSGTASIDAAGRTAHAGSFEAQAERMLDNIESLLAQHEATFATVMSAVTYLRRPSDAVVLRSLYRQRGFTGFPCVLVEAPLCRPELRCETEVVALLPPPVTQA